MLQNRNPRNARQLRRFAAVVAAVEREVDVSDQEEEGVVLADQADEGDNRPR